MRPSHPHPSVRSPSVPTDADRAVIIGRRSRFERRTVLALAGVVLSGWLLVVFAGALANAGELSSRADAERAVNASLEARAAGLRAEAAAIQGSDVLDHLARAYGMGGPRERRFALSRGAPSPAPIVPLGAIPTAMPGGSPLDAWLDLLFGS